MLTISKRTAPIMALLVAFFIALSPIKQAKAAIYDLNGAPFDYSYGYPSLSAAETVYGTGLTGQVTLDVASNFTGTAITNDVTAFSLGGKGSPFNISSADGGTITLSFDLNKGVVDNWLVIAQNNTGSAQITTTSSSESFPGEDLIAVNVGSTSSNIYAAAIANFSTNGTTSWNLAAGEVSDVPLPTALPLFVSALLLIAFFARNRKKYQA